MGIALELGSQLRELRYDGFFICSVTKNRGIEIQRTRSPQAGKGSRLDLLFALPLARYRGKRAINEKQQKVRGRLDFTTAPGGVGGVF